MNEVNKDIKILSSGATDSSGLFNNKNFIYHWIALGITQIGNFFTIVAIPWLVLYLTNDDPIIMTSVFAVINLPQGFFILFGGALADRFSPKTVLIYVRFGFFVTQVILACFVFIQAIPLWLLYILGFTLGTLGGFSHPAAQSMVPLIVSQKNLIQANGIVMGTMQMTQMLGPLIAGWLIWLGRQWSNIPETETDFNSIGFAFTIDAITVFIAAIITFKIRTSINQQKNSNIVAMVKRGFVYIWQTSTMRVVLAYVLITSFFIHGPLHSSMPLFTKNQLGLSEAVYGSLFAALGFGTLLGSVIAMTKFERVKSIGKVILICDLMSGINFALLSLSSNLWIAIFHLLMMGLCNGILMVCGTTWVQRRTPEELMGRVMGILFFCVMAFIPFSAVLVGYLIEKMSISHTILICGLAVVSCSLFGWLNKSIRQLGESI